MDGIDELTVEKSRGGDWTTIFMRVNGEVTSINLRGKQITEQLHFMLGQLLDEGN